MATATKTTTKKPVAKTPAKKKAAKKPAYVIVRKTHEIDATDKVLGRLASEIAMILNGKNKPTFERHVDDGDIVVVTNIKNIKVTGNKMQTKIYFRHSGYPGGLKRTKMSELFEKNPSEVLRKAVFNMLPKNRLRPGMMKRLKIS